MSIVRKNRKFAAISSSSTALSTKPELATIMAVGVDALVRDLVGLHREVVRSIVIELDLLFPGIGIIVRVAQAGAILRLDQVLC